MSGAAILVIEDNRDDEELTLLALQESNITTAVAVARDGEEALRYLFDQADNGDRLPALTLLDLNLPKLSGLEVLRRVRADPRTRSTPIVVLTSSKRDQDLVDSYDLGANAYMHKPVGFGEFAEAVRALGQFWLVYNEAPRTTDALRSPAGSAPT